MTKTEIMLHQVKVNKTEGNVSCEHILCEDCPLKSERDEFHNCDYFGHDYDKLIVRLELKKGKTC